MNIRRMLRNFFNLTLRRQYKIAFNQDGSIEAVDLNMYSNGGCSLDLSPAVMEVCMFAVDACYRFPSMHIMGHMCKTHRVSCTAFRGFGKPQAMVISEAILDHVAHSSGLTVQAVRDINLLRTGDTLLDHTPVEESLYSCYRPLYFLSIFLLTHV